MLVSLIFDAVVFEGTSKTSLPRRARVNAVDDLSGIHLNRIEGFPYFPESEWPRSVEVSMSRVDDGTGSVATAIVSPPNR